MKQESAIDSRATYRLIESRHEILPLRSVLTNFLLQLLHVRSEGGVRFTGSWNGTGCTWGRHLRSQSGHLRKLQPIRIEEDYSIAC